MNVVAIVLYFLRGLRSGLTPALYFKVYEMVQKLLILTIAGVF